MITVPMLEEKASPDIRDLELETFEIEDVNEVGINAPAKACSSSSSASSCCSSTSCSK
jgi:thiazolylpeptide-type bacteriocin precursor